MQVPTKVPTKSHSVSRVVRAVSALAITVGLGASVALPSASAQTSSTPVTTIPLPVSTINVVDQVKNTKGLSTLAAAIEAGGLSDTLRSGGPFTIFAPDNAAFELLPVGTLDELVKPQNRSRLASILGVHVVQGRYSVGDLQRSGQRLKSLGGTEIDISRRDNRVTINGAGIRQGDIVASNAVIHVIDTVLPVPAVVGGNNAIDQAKATANLKTFVAAVDAAGLTATLQTSSPITLFIPDDIAFELLGKDAAKDLLRPENKAALVAVLQRHVVSGRYTAADIAKLKPAELKTLGGSTVSFSTRNGKTVVNKAGILKADIAISNGVIHIIDTVL
jgi:transforming growth factor-beta-induced protein